ncbi:hypothetical protein LTR17_022814 [Elasticomyces elasticus]|nr:hypothetical protein LTR17_022814 [Elasticomyces elasticus]
MAPTQSICHRNTNMSTAVDGLQSNTNNYDHISDMHNVLLGVLAMATTVTVVWWQGRSNRGRRNAVSIDVPIVERDDLRTDQVDASGLNQLVNPTNDTQDAPEHSTIDNAQMEGAVDNPTVIHAVEDVLQETETHEI